MSKQIEKLESIKGKLFIHKEKEERVLNYKIEVDMICIHTDIDQYKIGFGDLNIFLRNFLLVDEHPVVNQNKGLVILDNEGTKSIKEILMNNIKRVQNNPEYIPQAKQINSDVNSIIELAKAEIELLKTQQKYG